MPADDYVLFDTVTSKYITTYTNVASFVPANQECDLKHIGLAEVRTHAQCNTIFADLETNPAYVGRFVVGSRPQ